MFLKGFRGDKEGREVERKIMREKSHVQGSSESQPIHFCLHAVTSRHTHRQTGKVFIMMV